MNARLSKVQCAASQQTVVDFGVAAGTVIPMLPPNWEPSACVFKFTMGQNWLMPALNTLPEQLLTERLLIRVAKPGDGQVYNAAVIESLPELAPWLQWASVAPTLDVSERACRHAYGCFLLDEDLMALFFDRTSGVLIGGGGPAQGRLETEEV